MVLFFTGEMYGGTRNVHWVLCESLWPTQQVCLKPQRIKTKDYDETQINKWPTNLKQCTPLVRNAQCFSILGYSSPKILDFWTLNVLILLL